MKHTGRDIFLGIGAVIAIALAVASYQTVRAATVSGDLVKGSFPAVYYVGADGKRYVFPNDKIFFSWYADFSSVKKIADDELAGIQIGGNVTYRPGVKLVKIQSDPRTYAVARGGVLRWVKTEAAAIGLYGADWNKKVDDLADAFFVNYQTGADITVAADYSLSGELASATSINDDKRLGGSVAPPPPVACTATNVCVNSGTVRKNTCAADGTITSTDVACGAGQACASGVCVPRVAVQTVNARVMVIDRTDVCFEGDVCTSGNCCDVGGVKFADNSNLVAVKKRDAYLYPGKQELCGYMATSTQDRNVIPVEVTSFEDSVRSATGGMLNPATNYTHLSGQFTMSRRPGSCNWWFSPDDLREVISSAADSNTDTVAVLGKSSFSFGEVPLGAPYVSVDQSAGVKGSGYSYVDIGAGFSAPLGEIASKLVGAFDDQIASALRLGITDAREVKIYGPAEAYPACHAPTTAYFPTSSSCTMDPDAASCGAVSCTDVAGYRTHVLQSHYNPAWTVIGNHCRDGRMDIDETGPDCGGTSCNACS
jgi:hypothetical protein